MRHFFFLFIALILVSCNADAVEPLSDELEQIDHYTASTGSLIFIGTLKNTGETPLEFIKVHINLLDGNAKLVASDFTYAYLDVVWPAQNVPFTLIFQDDVTGWENYELSIEANRSTGSLAYTDLEILSHEGSVRSTGSYQIIGEIKNTGEQPATSVQIAAMLYDAEGNLVANDIAYTDFDEILPGDTSTFNLITSKTGLGVVDHYELLYEADRLDDHPLQLPLPLMSLLRNANNSGAYAQSHQQ
jgi:hypothetical protein